MCCKIVWKFCEIWKSYGNWLPDGPNSVRLYLTMWDMACMQKFSSLFIFIVGNQIHYNTIWAATWQNQQSDCAPSEDSDQSGHPPSLIRVSAVRMKKATHWAHSEDSDQTGRMPRLIWVFAGRTVTLLVLSCRRSYDKHYCIHPFRFSLSRAISWCFKAS